MKIDSPNEKILLRESGHADLFCSLGENSFLNTTFSVEYTRSKTSGKPQSLTSDLIRSSASRQKITESRILFKDENLQFAIETRRSSNHIGVFWRAVLQNISDEPIFIHRIILCDGEVLSSQNQFPIKNPAFYSNGWQSWSYSGAYHRGDKMIRSRLGQLQNPMVLNPGTPSFRQKNIFSSDFFGILADLNTRIGWVFGFLSQRQHFGTITADLRSTPRIRLWANGDHARLDPGAEIATDWAAFFEIHIDDPDPMGPYLSAIASENGVDKLPPSPSGWCSWYHYYQNVSDTDILKNLSVLKHNSDRLPLSLVQIDDGFEKQVGDWFEFNSRFPNGVAPLATKITDAGFVPGLWLAPFIVHPKSDLYRDHPDWILRDEKGKVVNAGFQWGRLSTALDLTVPAALEFACDVIRTAVEKWKYPYLKLDFLYAAAVVGKYSDDRCTHAQVLFRGMTALREAAGKDTFLLGCGLPLGSAVGTVDALRVGADVSGSWTPRFNNVGFPFKNEKHMPSARNSIQNILTRAFMHDTLWINDPDCLLVRKETQLNEHEIISLATVISLTSGSIFFSDDITALPADRIDLVASLLPPIGKRAWIVDWLDAKTPSRLRLDLSNCLGSWHILAAFNWKDESQVVSLLPSHYFLDDRDYYVSSFWERISWKSDVHAPLYQGVLAPHACVTLAVRTTQPGSIYIGSNLHISQGLEIKQWQDSLHKLKVSFDTQRVAEGYADIKLNIPPKAVNLSQNKPVKWEYMFNGIYRFEIMIDHVEDLIIQM